MGEFCYRLKLIMWKNYLLRKRHKKRTIIEILWPLVLFLILMWVRTRGLTENMPNCHMIPKALPSVGGLEFIQNVFCSINNPCFNSSVENTGHWNSSTMNRIVPVLDQFMMNTSAAGLFHLWLNFLKASENLSIQKGRAVRNVPSAPGEPSGDVDQENVQVLASLRQLSDTLVRIDNGKDSATSKPAPDGAGQLYRMFCGNLTKSSTESSARNFSSDGDSLLTDAQTKFTPDPDATPECNSYFRNFTESAIQDLVWKVFKIYVRGVIYYAPDNRFTRAVMAQVETKIKELRGIEDNVNTALRILRRFQDWEMGNRQNLELLNFMLSNATMLDGVLQRMGIQDRNRRKEILAAAKRFHDQFALSNPEDVRKTVRDTINALEFLAGFLKCVKYDKVKGFLTERQAVAASMPLIPQHRIWAVVVFQMNANDSDPPEFLQYKIRLDSDKVDTTFRTHTRPTSRKSPRRDPLFDLKYITFGFTFLEEMIERAVVEVRTGKSMEGVMVYLQQFPFPCYIFDEYIQEIGNVFPLLMILSWIYSAATMIKYIVYEKQNHLKEMMSIVGLSNFTHWMGWFVDNFLVLFVSATLLTIILKFGKILTYSDFTLIWFFMLSFTISVISFSFMFSTFFNVANSAAAAGGIMFFLSFMPYSLSKRWLQDEYLQWYQILPVCLFSNVAFGFGCNYFAQMERDGLGARWGSLGESTDSSFFELRYSIMMLWCDSFLYMLLALYVEAVSPGGGIPKPWYFLFLPSTYSRNGPPEPMLTHSDTALEDEADTRFIEPVQEGLIAGVKIRGLSKTYSNGNVALKSLSIDFYEDQITSFLGHNGAGKSTTISILTGLFPPTKGTALINECDITKDIKGGRRNVGVCPQYNILFEKLTVSEHIIFFSSLKGKEFQATGEELDGILNDLGIPEKRNEFPNNLSGGMKRKLCVAIAFSGNSKTIFLDEPTSGVDPFSRRAIWELLLKYKQGRTIILTTHFMDEADILGDRIAIISRGTLKTCGSGLYLKNHFGEGYSLHLVCAQKAVGLPEERRLSKVRESGVEDKGAPETMEDKRLATKAIIAFLQSRIPEAAMTSNIGSEISFVLPYASASMFPALLKDLETNMKDLGILSYGISDTTLEDVFLKVITEDLEHTDSFAKRSKGCPCFGCCRSTLGDTNKVEDGKVQMQDIPVGSLDSAETPKEDLSVELTETDSPATSDHRVGEDMRNSGEIEVKSAEVSQPNLALTEMHEAPSVAASVANAKPKSSPHVPPLLYLVQIRAIITKRFINSRRSLKSVFFEIVLPVIFVAAALIFATVMPVPRDSPPLEITPYEYPAPLHVFFSDQSRNSSVGTFANPDIPVGKSYISRIVDELVGPLGFSTECLPHKISREQSRCAPNQFSNISVENFHSNRASFVNVQLGKCFCSSGYQECESVEKKAPPKLNTHMASKILDVTKFELPEWLLKTYYKYYDERVAGYEFKVHKPYPVNLTRFLLLLDHFTLIIFENDTSQGVPNITQDAPTNAITVWYDNKAYISSIAYLNAFHNIALRDLLPDSGISTRNRSGLSLFQHPLERTEGQRLDDAFLDVLIGLYLAICMINALSYVPASFVLYLIQERACGGKHLHLVSGVKPIVYWLANFIYDLTKFLIPVGLAVILFVIFDVQAFISKDSILAFAVLLILYGWAVIPLMYPASHLFSVPSTAFVVLACTNIFFGVITTISEFVLQRLPYPDLEEIGKLLGRIYTIFPQYCLGRGMINLVIVHAYSSVQNSLAIKFEERNRFDWDLLGSFLLSLFVQGIVFFVFNLVVEYRTWIYMKIVKPKPRYSADNFNDEDEDVHEERMLIMESSNDPNAVLIAQRLTKYYGRKRDPAVNGITFAIGKGECFGLLGINGAGKTSTFKMLTGDVIPSGGEARIAGHDLVLKRDEARKHVGYCPQEDGLDLLLNADEVLQLYGSLKGMKSADKKQASAELIETLGLSRYAARKCGSYSGGNKRKLSTAVALIGDPDVIFLDEPTSGMDPGARRKLWKVILLLVRMEKSVVLTTHSMEECEALCSRIGIMVNGKFECLGSSQHLKNRFGTGYMLTVRCLAAEQAAFTELMLEQMPNALLDSSHCSQIKFRIPQETAKLSDIFEMMQVTKGSGLIEEYSVSQTTLDDIFVKFASHQKEE